MKKLFIILALITVSAKASADEVRFELRCLGNSCIRVVMREPVIDNVITPPVVVAAQVQAPPPVMANTNPPMDAIVTGKMDKSGANALIYRESKQLNYSKFTNLANLSPKLGDNTYPDLINLSGVEDMTSIACMISSGKDRICGKAAVLTN